MKLGIIRNKIYLIKFRNEKYQYVKDFEVIKITLEDLRAEHLSA